MKKMTKIDLFKNCINFIKGEPTSVDTWIANEGKFRQEEISPTELIEGLEHEIELLQRKSSTPRKPSATQTENETLKSLIVDYLSASDSMYTIKELQSAIPELSALSNQRVSHLLKALREAKIVKRSYVKKIAFFSLGVEEDTAEE